MRISFRDIADLIFELYEDFDNKPINKTVIHMHEITQLLLCMLRYISNDPLIEMTNAELLRQYSINLSASIRWTIDIVQAMNIWVKPYNQDEVRYQINEFLNVALVLIDLEINIIDSGYIL